MIRVCFFSMSNADDLDIASRASPTITTRMGVVLIGVVVVVEVLVSLLTVHNSD